MTSTRLEIGCSRKYNGEMCMNLGRYTNPPKKDTVWCAQEIGTAKRVISACRQGPHHQDSTELEPRMKTR